MNRGLFAGILAYTLWGFMPIFWKSLHAVPALESVSHRTIWALGVILLLLGLRRQWSWIQQVRKRPRLLLAFAGSAALLSMNWLTYIWAVNSAHVVDSSLGYFINPLFSVLLGALFLRERLRPWQVVAVVIAGLGVLYLTVGYGAFPWIGLTLALTFGFYGLLRKTAPLGSMEGLSIETAILSVPSLAYLIYLEGSGGASFGHSGVATSILLVLSGVATAVPLLLFAYSARRVSLATVGILQYIAPTFQFLLGVFLYGEPFTIDQLLGFAPIWLAVIIYSAEGLVVERRRRAGRVAAR
ncbi:MAG: EamA family transporter RarD [Anaerolineae bacterium]